MLERWQCAVREAQRAKTRFHSIKYACIDESVAHRLSHTLSWQAMTQNNSGHSTVRLGDLYSVHLKWALWPPCHSGRNECPPPFFETEPIISIKSVSSDCKCKQFISERNVQNSRNGISADYDRTQRDQVTRRQNSGHQKNCIKIHETKWLYIADMYSRLWLRQMVDTSIR
jgi:hypothetical protein